MRDVTSSLKRACSDIIGRITQAFKDPAGDSAHFVFAHATRRAGRSSKTKTAGLSRTPRVEGNKVLVGNQTDRFQRLLGRSTGDIFFSKVHHHQMVIGTAREQSVSMLLEGARQASWHSPRSVASIARMPAVAPRQRPRLWPGSDA